MSVLARLRSASKLDVLDLAEEIRAEATRLVWNTNVVPKGWRDIFAKPMCLLCHKLYNQIRAANRIWSTTEELVEKRKAKAKREIKAILKESTARRTELIQNIISGKVDPIKDEAKEIEMIWGVLADLNANVSNHAVQCFFLDKDWYDCTDEERQEAEKKAANLSVLHQMLITLNVTMKGVETFDYGLKFKPGTGKVLMKGYDTLIPYGWYFDSEDEKKVLDGTHELYKKEPEK